MWTISRYPFTAKERGRIISEARKTVMSPEVIRADTEEKAERILPSALQNWDPNTDQDKKKALDTYC